MDIRKKQRAVVDALEDIKGRDIVVFNTERLSPFFERVIIASGDSTRQVKALAHNVQDRLKKIGAKVYGVEGEATAEWVLVDLGDIVVHAMHPTVRLYYNLEEIWGGKEVSLRRAPEPTLRAAPRPKAVTPKPKAPTFQPRAASPKPRAASTNPRAGSTNPRAGSTKGKSRAPSAGTKKPARGRP